MSHVREIHKRYTMFVLAEQPKGMDDWVRNEMISITKYCCFLVQCFHMTNIVA